MGRLPTGRAPGCEGHAKGQQISSGENENRSVDNPCLFAVAISTARFDRRTQDKELDAGRQGHDSQGQARTDDLMRAKGALDMNERQ